MAIFRPFDDSRDQRLMRWRKDYCEKVTKEIHLVVIFILWPWLKPPLDLQQIVTKGLPGSEDSS